jgi:hypothetical protein
MERYFSIRYWFDGNESWCNRWLCTDGDILLCIATILATLWMATEYVRYARKNHQRIQNNCHVAFVRHITRLRNVFVQCGAIHIIGSVVSWPLPVYWVLVALTVYNAFDSRRLNTSKDFLIAIEEYEMNEKAVQKIESMDPTSVNVSQEILILQDSMKRMKKHMRDKYGR